VGITGPKLGFSKWISIQMNFDVFLVCAFIVYYLFVCVFVYMSVFRTVVGGVGDERVLLDAAANGMPAGRGSAQAIGRLHRRDDLMEKR
jgi:hypothetical protein